MSGRTSLSSGAFNCSLTHLISEDPLAAWFEVDELFGSEEVRRRLAKKLLKTKLQKQPSSLQPESVSTFGSQFSSQTSGSDSQYVRDFIIADLESALAEGDSTEAAEKVADADSLFAKLFGKRRTDSSDGSESTVSDIPLAYTPWRVFLNCVDTFNTKHIAHFLFEKIHGSLIKPVEMDEEEGEEEYREEPEMYGEDEEMPFPRKEPKEEPPKMNYEIFGSLLEPDGKYDKEVVSRIVETSDKIRLLKTLKTCGFIIYDVSRHEKEIREARWIVQTLQYELQLMERWFPDVFPQLKNVPTFVLISTFMTWAKHRGPFTEAGYRKRKCHPHYEDHLQLEKDVLAAGKVYPDKFRTLVLCSGVQYGREEDVLSYLFNLGWENEPALPLYAPPKNFVPLVHVADLAAMVYNVLELFPKEKRYLLAVERDPSTIKAITQAISKGLAPSGELLVLPKEQMRFLKLPQHVSDSLNANVLMEPGYFANIIPWMSEASFAPNIDAIVQEYVEYRNLQSKRVVVLGPPLSGKTTLAKSLADRYYLHYLDAAGVGERRMRILRGNLKRHQEREKERRSKRPYDEMGEEMSEEEDGEEMEGEEDEEGPEAWKRELSELENSEKENGGKLSQGLMLRSLRRLLTSPPLRNQGYVLDALPATVRQARMLFRGGGMGEEEGIEEEALEEEEEEESLEDDGRPPPPLPDVVIGLLADEELLLRRAMESGTEDEAAFRSRLAAYRSDSVPDLEEGEAGVLGFFDERESHPLLVHAEDMEPGLERVYRAMRGAERQTQPEAEPESEVGAAEKKAEGKAAEKAAGKAAGDATARKPEAGRASRTAAGLPAAGKAAPGKAAAGKAIPEESGSRRPSLGSEGGREGMSKAEQWATAAELLAEEEAALADANALPLRHYLTRLVLPRLVNALSAAERARDSAPLDYVAERLFLENPEGRLEEPEYNEVSRALFRDLAAVREELFALVAVEPPEADSFFPPDVLGDRK